MRKMCCGLRELVTHSRSMYEDLSHRAGHAACKDGLCKGCCHTFLTHVLGPEGERWPGPHDTTAEGIVAYLSRRLRAQHGPPSDICVHTW